MGSLKLKPTLNVSRGGLVGLMAEMIEATALLMGAMKTAPDLLFRAVFSSFWVLFLTVFARVAHSTKWSSGRQTSALGRRLRIVALGFAGVYFAGAVVYALLPGWVMFLSIPLPGWPRLVMVGVAVVGMAFLLWALRTLGKNWAPSLSGVRRDTSLVTDGPYRIVRHPIYLGVFIFLVALAVVAANLLIALPTLALLILLYAQLPDEESMLIDRFGDAYRNYMKRTPRFIPRLRLER